MNKLYCFFSGHEWIGIDWRANGKKAVDWAFNIVPEYDRTEQCTRCKKIVVEQYTSLIDYHRPPKECK